MTTCCNRCMAEGLLAGIQGQLQLAKLRVEQQEHAYAVASEARTKLLLSLQTQREYRETRAAVWYAREVCTTLMATYDHMVEVVKYLRLSVEQEAYALHNGVTL